MYFSNHCQICYEKFCFQKSNYAVRKAKAKAKKEAKQCLQARVIMCRTLKKLISRIQKQNW